MLHLLCEGNSIRGTARLVGVSKTTILKLVEDAGCAAAWYQDRVFHNLKCKRIQVDEVWGFCRAKAKNADPVMKAAPRGAFSLWAIHMIVPSVAILRSRAVSLGSVERDRPVFADDIVVLRLLNS